MSDPPSGWRHRVPLSLVVGIGTLVGLNAWWLERFRAGNPLSVDEAGYLTMGFADAAGLRTGGPVGLWHAFSSSKLEAPLAPLLTVPFHLVLGWSLATGFALSLTLFAVLGVLTYAIAARVMARRWAVLAALTAMSAPGVADNARDFLLALPLAVMLTAAVWALMRAEGMSRTWWAVAAGVFLGLSVLSRTMGLGFAAGPLAAGGLQAVSLPGARRRLANLAAMVAAAFAVAAPWYAGSFSTVLPYLEGKSPYFHLESHPGPPGAHHAGPFWRSAIHDLFQHVLFLPLGLGLTACALLGLAGLVWRRLASRRPATTPPSESLQAPTGRSVRPVLGAGAARLRAACRSPVFAPAVVLAEGWLVLSLSHQSVGQSIPLVAVMVVCALRAVLAAPRRALRAGMAAFLALMVVVNTVMVSDTVPWLSRDTRVTLPLAGRTPVVDGVSDAVHLLVSAHQPAGGATGPVPARDRQWMAVSRSVAGWLLHHHALDDPQAPLVVAFSSTDLLFNTNSVQLEGELGSHTDIPMAQLDPAIGGNRVAAYRYQLSAPQFGQPDAMVSVDPGPGEFRPEVDQRVAQSAARSLGFTVVDRFVLPDGRHGRIWWRTSK